MRKIYMLLLTVCFAAAVNAQNEKLNAAKVIAPTTAIGITQTADNKQVSTATVPGTTVTAPVQLVATGGTKTASYTTLKEAFDAINKGVHTGDITIGIAGNTMEAVVKGAASVVLKPSGTGAASYTSLTILPVGGEPRKIMGGASPGFPLIDFGGAENVHIYGMNKTGDLLTIIDTTTQVRQEFNVDYSTLPELTNKFKFEEMPSTQRSGDPDPNVISATTYAFVSGSGTLEDMSSGTTMLLTPDLDDAASSIAPIGFDFWFDGTRQLYFSVNANGLMRLGSTAVSTAFTNDLASATNVPQVAPYWDDLWVGNNGKVHYKVVGTAPNRRLVVEWMNMQIPRVATATAGAGTFQAWLYEGSGMIEFIYGAGIAANATNSGASIGFGSSATQFVSITASGPTAAYGVANNTNTGAIASGTKYRFISNTPTAPGALSFTAVGLNTMTLNWADNATNEVGYAIYRSFDGVNYEFIRQIAANSISSVESGLASNTTYYWNVYAVTEGNLGTATSGNQATTTGTLSGTANIGPTGTYASIGAAVTAINTNGLAGNYLLELQPAYVSGVETFPLVLNVVGSPSNTITLRPETGATGLTIAGGAATQTLNLNSSAYWTIDGRAGGAGASQLTVSNTSTTGVPIQLINDARNNTIRYITVAGVNTATTGGDVVFSTTTGSIGNSNNTIDNCDIKDGATTPTNGIYSLGSAAAINTNNTISNNLIHDNFSAGSVTNGILLSSAAGNLGNTRWTISGNRFYQTPTRTYTTGNIHAAISIGANTGALTTGFGYSVTGNIIGYASSAATGTYTMAGTIATRFIGINLNVGAEPTSVQNNTIAAFSLATSSGATTTSGVFSGINVLQGNVNIGTVTGNTIGSTSATGSIVTTPTTTLALNVGISVHTNPGGVAAINISNNNIGGFTANGSGSISGIAMSAGQPTITNNVIGSNSTALSMNSPTVAVASTLQHGINIQASTTGSVSPTVITNNTIANFSSAGTGTAAVMRGIANASIGQATITGNTIHDLSSGSANTTLAGGGTGVQGIMQTGTAALGATISQNTIYTIIASNTGAVQSNATGIGYSNPTAGTITRNKIYDIRNLSTMATATTPPTASGIMVRTGVTSFSVINNMISLGTGQTTNTEFIGIWNSFAGTSLIAHYNSVHIAGTAASGALPSYAFLRGDNTAASAIITTMDIKNNILNNTRNGGTGKHYAIGNVNSVPATGWSGTASNNNVLNSAVSTTIGNWGLGVDQTFAQWKASSLGDLSSLSGVTVTFVDVTTGDLHANYGLTPTALESGGVAVATTTDYDAQTRPGPAGSVNGGALAPDIGADEFDAVPQDITAPSITYTPLTFTCATGDRALNGVTIADATGVPTSGSFQPRVYYRKNLGTWFSSQGTLATGTGINGTWNFTIIAADMGGLVATDVVQYYVIAQDLAVPTNIGANPGAGLVASDVNTVTTAPTSPNSYTIANTMSGTYLVGAAQVPPNFTTLTAAVAAYNSSCLGGAVVFELTDATYSGSETFPITINANPDASGTNTLTIRPGSGVNAAITGSNAASIIKLNAADYITIEGSNNGSSSRNLTISNTNTGTSSAVVWLASTLTPANGATNNTLKNTIVIGNASTTTLGAVVSSGSVMGGIADAANSNNMYDNNEIKQSFYGLALVGPNGNESGLVVRNNTVGSAVAVEKIGLRSIALFQQAGASVANNTVLGVNSTSTGTNSFASGIAVLGTVSGGSINGNTITDLKKAGAWGVAGITIASGSTGVGMTISNNFISDVAGGGYTLGNGIDDNGSGIFMNGGSGYTIHYNSINMATTQATAGSFTQAINIASGVSAAGAVDIRNNILVNSTTNTGGRYAIYSGAPASVYSSIDYNDYYTAGTLGSAAGLGFIAATSQTTLAAMQGSFGGNTNSQNGLPTFMSGTNLHLVAVDVNNFTYLESKGVAVTVTNDIDGQSRPNGSAPDIGADEYVGSVPVCSPPTTPIMSAITSTTATATWSGTGPFILEYGPAGYTPGTGATAGVGGTLIDPAVSPQGISGLTPSTTYDLYVRTVCAGPTWSPNTTVVTFTTVPLNDLCSGALAIPCNGSLSGNNTAATNDALPGITCGSTTPTTGTNRAVWFTVTPAFSGSMTVSTCSGATWDTYLRVYDGTCGSFTACMGFDDDGCSAQSTVTFTAVGGTTYYIMLGGFGGSDFGAYTISATCPTACATPPQATMSAITSTTATATWAGAGSYILEYGPTGYTPGTAGTAGVGGTLVDPAVSPQALSGLTPATTYDLYVRTVCAGPTWSPNSPVRTFTTLTPPPANDDAPGAIALTVGASCSGSPFTNVAATQSVNEPFAACKGSAGFNTVWYSFMAPASGAVKVSTDYSGGTHGDSRMALFSTTNVNDYTTFTNIACDDDNGSTSSLRSILYATGLTAGTTYYIQVDGFSASTTQGTFCLTVDELSSSMLSTATACGTGQSLSLYNNNYTGWISATDNSGNLMALISNQTGGAGTSTFDNAANINAAAVRTDAVSGQYYLDRNFRINNSSVTSANVRFFYLNTELTALQAVDPAVTAGNLQVTRQTGTTCQSDFVAANGTNSSIAQTGNGGGTGYRWVQVTTPGFSNFYLNTMRTYVPVKVWLSGAYSGIRHRDVSATWAAVLNANALSQPYNTAAFGNYAGTESVSGGFFTSTVATTDITDWVLLELRDATTPSTIIARRAAFVREDGRIVDLNGTSDVSFRNLAIGNYFVVIRHRNHLGIRTAAAQTYDGTMGVAIPAVYDYSTAQTQAYQDPVILALAPPNNNNAMRDVGGGVFGMWGGNGNTNTTVRASGPLAQNDYLFLIQTTLGSDVNLVLPNVYHLADYNMDGQVRANGPLAQNDYLFLISTMLGNDVNKTVSQHQ